MALTDKLSAIGVAIREKTGGTELLTLDAMPDEIRSIQTGGGGGGNFPVVLSGDCESALDNHFFSQLKDYLTITTENITNLYYFAANTAVPKLDFDINIEMGASRLNMQYAFSNTQLLEVPALKCAQPWDSTEFQMAYMFQSSQCLFYIPYDFFDFIPQNCWDYMIENSGQSKRAMFNNCFSLKKLPDLRNLYHLSAVSQNYSIYYNGFTNCNTLDEIVDLPVYPNTTWTSNAFYKTFDWVTRCKRITFATNEDGSAKKATWRSSQNIDLTLYVGYTSGSWSITEIEQYTGIGMEQRVNDAESYERLKNTDDWWTDDPAYCRYNHDSAVETINTLPDISESITGTNTITFKASSGSATDGGAISSLTDAEIAVAAAKGWTVSFVQ